VLLGPYPCSFGTSFPFQTESGGTGRWPSALVPGGLFPVRPDFPARRTLPLSEELDRSRVLVALIAPLRSAPFSAMVLPTMKRALFKERDGPRARESNRLVPS